MQRHRLEWIIKNYLRPPKRKKQQHLMLFMLHRPINLIAQPKLSLSFYLFMDEIVLMVGIQRPVSRIDSNLRLFFLVFEYRLRYLSFFDDFVAIIWLLHAMHRSDFSFYELCFLVRCPGSRIDSNLFLLSKIDFKIIRISVWQTDFGEMIWQFGIPC